MKQQQQAINCLPINLDQVAAAAAAINKLLVPVGRCNRRPVG